MRGLTEAGHRNLCFFRKWHSPLVRGRPATAPHFYLRHCFTLPLEHIGRTIAYSCNTTSYTREARGPASFGCFPLCSLSFRCTKLNWPRKFLTGVLLFARRVFAVQPYPVTSNRLRRIGSRLVGNLRFERGTVSTKGCCLRSTTPTPHLFKKINKYDQFPASSSRYAAVEIERPLKREALSHCVQQLYSGQSASDGQKAREATSRIRTKVDNSSKLGRNVFGVLFFFKKVPLHFSCKMCVADFEKAGTCLF